MDVITPTMDQFEWISMLLKIGIVCFAFVNIVPIMVWVERRGSAFMQNRTGPNRVGPLGLFQSLADVVKFIFKEDLVPDHVEKFYFLLAPALSVIVAFMTFAVVPFAGQLQIGDRIVNMQLTNLNVGVLYVLSIASMGVYGIILAGWSSRNKYAMLGGLRSSAQMISYELPLGISILGILMVFESLSPAEIVAGQSQLWLGPVHKWGIFIQPLGFLIFLTSIYAETNRLPFDLPEGESELVAGFHLEYGSMKFALFFMAEYMNMLVGSAMVTTLFLGGFDFWPLGFAVEPLANHVFMPLIAAVPALSVLNALNVATVVLQLAAFVGKVSFLMWLFVWVRWTLPRFRYDQLMDLGWKVMLPLSLANVVITALLIYLKII